VNTPAEPQRPIHPTIGRRRQFTASTAATLVGVMLLLTACGGSDSASTADVFAPTASYATAATDAAPAASAAPAAAEAPTDLIITAEAPADTAAAPDSGVPPEQVDSGETGSAAFPVIPVPGRSIAYTAGMSLETSDVSATVTKIGEIAVAAGGTVFDADINLDTPGEERGTLTVKVPPAGLGSAVAQIGELGRVTSRTQDAEDVTAQVIDLDARILTAAASVDRVRAFLEEATNVSELAGLEAELTQRETELEQLRAQQRGLGERVSLATLNIELLSPPLPVVEEPEPVVEVKKPTTVGSAFRAGRHTLGSILRGIAIGAAAAAPLMVLIIPALLLLVLLTRRYRRKHPKHQRVAAAPYVYPPAPAPEPAPVPEP
jgi:hypothetical protein